MNSSGLRPARLPLSDMARVAAAGLRTRPLRVILSALGIAIGIAAMVATVGISASSQAQVNKKMDTLGSDLLVATAGETESMEMATLPKEAVAMVSRIDDVYSASGVGFVEALASRADVPQDPELMAEPNFVAAVDVELARTVRARLLSGVWFNEATASYPTVVLGFEAARRLGIGTAGSDVLIEVDKRPVSVIGVLDKVKLAPELDDMVLAGWDFARQKLGFDGHPATIYERSDRSAVKQVRALMPATINPQHPSQVEVGRPSDGLDAKKETDTAFSGLLLGLGAVALLVGGIGVANTMVISVLERRSEVGLRRALGATRRHIWSQFLSESLLLSLLGGVLGSALGIAATAIYAGAVRDWPIVLPPWAALGAVGATVVIGAIAGLYPAVRAARLDPTRALSA